MNKIVHSILDLPKTIHLLDYFKGFFRVFHAFLEIPALMRPFNDTVFYLFHSDCFDPKNYHRGHPITWIRFLPKIKTASSAPTISCCTFLYFYFFYLSPFKFSFVSFVVDSIPQTFFFYSQKSFYGNNNITRFLTRQHSEFVN